MSKYTPQFFIDKFATIPDVQWCLEKDGDDNKHSALGHCGQQGSRKTEMGEALDELFKKALGVSVTNINDAKLDQLTMDTKTKDIIIANDKNIKQRVLLMLAYLKEKENLEKL